MRKISLNTVQTSLRINSLKISLLLLALLAGFAGSAQTKGTETPPAVTEFKFDTLYQGGKYSVTLLLFRERELEYENVPNTIFGISVWEKGVWSPIYTDSVYNWVQEVLFEDFNGDNIPDILVQNTSSARSNYTYNLYLVDTAHNQFKKIKGFETIYNPQYLPEYDLIKSNASSGINRIGFYGIRGNRILDFGISVEDHQSDENRVIEADARAYDKALKEALQKRKQRK